MEKVCVARCNATDLNSARRDASNGTLLMRGGLLEVGPRLGPSTGVWRLQQAFFGAGPSAVLLKLGPARAVRVQAAATRRERTRRPNFRCMIGPYDPAGRCAAGWVTVPGLRPRISSRQVRDPHTHGRRNAQKSHYGRCERPGTRGLLHAARGCPSATACQISTVEVLQKLTSPAIFNQGPGPCDNGQCKTRKFA